MSRLSQTLSFGAKRAPSHGRGASAQRSASPLDPVLDVRRVEASVVVDPQPPAYTSGARSSAPSCTEKV